MSSFQFAFSAPSNIALIKYWGKGVNQLPKNASISFSLKHSMTKTYLESFSRQKNDKTFELLFEGKTVDKFNPKMEAFFQRVLEIYPALTQFHFKIHSENTFPHSTGIASSASSMAALSLCITQLATELNLNLPFSDFYQSASFLARLGSGSASRSVYGGFTLWGESESAHGSSNEFAIDINNLVHPTMKELGDSILIVSSQEKSLSSSEGHRLMNNNPYAVPRFLEANRLIGELLQAMKVGDFEKWGEMIKKEALGLHALMMLSEGSPILLKPASLELVNLVRHFRAHTKLPIYFTIDAGPNLHLIYPLTIKSQVQQFIQDQCLQLLENSQVIHDQIGLGPQKISWKK
jgi:diphosphomevalonate decarboxylase